MEHRTYINDMLALDFPGARLQHKDLRMNAELERVVDQIAEENNSSLASKRVKIARPQPASISDQLEQVQAINIALRERIASERMRINHEKERRLTELQQTFDRRMAEAISKIEEERRTELRHLQDEFHEEMREIDKVSQRLD